MSNPNQSRMSNKSFTLFLFMWVAVMFIAMDFIECGHWLVAMLLCLIALGITFVVTD